MSGGPGSGARGTGAECRKFAPNIFNKSKCSSCFKQKEEHSAEALESNRATRKISKCGYLFVAPGWDFSNPLNRTKRWQRRWFVLYDDGELTYSVDEHPETVPQARIDMTRVLEVAAAEDVTGHPYSLAITSPEGVTFIKGTCREEARWWADVLQVYSRNKGRHKRNATFPGGQTTILQITPTVRSNTPNPSRPRFNSCRSEPRGSSTSWIPEATSSLCNSAFSSLSDSLASSPSITTTTAKPTATTPQNSTTNGLATTYTGHNNKENVSCDQLAVKDSSVNNNNNINSSPLRNGTGVHAYATSSITINGTMPPIAVSSSPACATPATTSLAGSVCSEKPPICKSSSCAESARSYKDQPASSASPPTRDKLRAEDKARRRVLGQQQQQQQPPLDRTVSAPLETINKLDDEACRRILLDHEREREGKLRDIAASLTQPRVRRNKPRASEPTRDVVDTAAVTHQDKLIRGDPDGCVLDISGNRYSPTCELRVDLPAEDLLNIKKGWLMKQGANKEWNKHWFVLRGCGLMYYRDPSAEDKGIMDGVIDLNTVTAVTSVQVARNYGFQTITWDDRGTTVLSAVTAGIRANWMSAIRKAANLPDPDNNPLDSHTNCQERQEEMSIQSPTASIEEHERDFIATSTGLTGLTGRSVLFSSDEEYRTASEGGRRESGDWSEVASSPPLTNNVVNGEWGTSTPKTSSSKHEWSDLPPSPPLTRTALSRVKARSRSSSRSRVYKRSRSSPPSSRRSTLDSVQSEDLEMACCELGLNKDMGQSSSQISINDCRISSSGNGSDNPHLIVELLEDKLSTFRDQSILDHNNKGSGSSVTGNKSSVSSSTVVNSNGSQTQSNSLLVIVERQESEIKGLKSQLNVARNELASAHSELLRLGQQKTETEKQLEQVLGNVQRNEQQRNKQQLDELDKMKKLYSRDKELLERKLLETEAILRETSERCQMLTNQLESSHTTVEHLQAEVTTLTDRLSQGIEENERLYARVRELEGKNGLSSSRERGRSYDSLSDLTNIDLDLDLNAFDKERIMEEYDELRSRFEKAVLEIRAMRKELREAHATQDVLELEIFAHKQESTQTNESNQAQVQLMAAKIQDLTNKLAGSEKQVRMLKQKLTKAESRDKRRSLSLKGRESFQISQEVEDKLVDLEKKISALERGKGARSVVAPETTSKESSSSTKKERTKKENRSLDRSRVRRKSLDSATSSEPMKVLIRLSTLESKVANVTAETTASDAEKDSSECSEISGASSMSRNDVSAEVVLRLRRLEHAVAKSKRRLDSYLGSTRAEEKAHKCLLAVNEILDACVEHQRKKNDASCQITESVGVVVTKLEAILSNKMHELVNRRRQLSEAGQLDDKEKIKLAAERLAFESVILRQIKCAMNGTLERGAVLSELVETSQLISSLKLKVNGTKPKTYQNTSYIQYLTKVLATKLVLIGGVPKTKERSTEISAARAEALNFLLQRQKEVNQIVDNYKNDKLKRLAEALAAETCSMSEPEEINKQVALATNKLVEDKRIREAWIIAQETVNKELVQVEVSHFIMRCGQIYEQNVSSVADSCLSFDAAQIVDFESWADKAQTILRQEMENTIHYLVEEYEKTLHQLKKSKCNVESQYDSKQLLSDYTDVIAQKALIDARISVLQESARTKTAFTGQSFVSSLIRHEDLLSSLLAEDYTFENNAIHDAEFIHLYQQFTNECDDKISNRQQSQEQIKNVAQVLADVSSGIDGLKQCVKDKMRDKIDILKRPQTASASDWVGVCEKCKEIREEIKRISDNVRSASCKQCEQLQDKITWLSAEHAKELEQLKKTHEQDLIDIKGKWDNERNSLKTQFEHEAASLRERARKLEHRLNAMDSEYSAHVNELRAAYQRSISTELDTDAETRKRYKDEIKQLRALCEKGLLAMENSHRRIIAELEEKHRQELENLRIEKEQALSEETQATLAALDAMRKAHEHEVQKEIAKFKQEFIKQVQAREDIGILHKEHEEEMEEIKQEILSLSAKYSQKCVESAALEEKVGALTKQVAQAQQHIMQLDARNKQLRAHLVLETNDTAFNDTIQLLRGRDSEIAEQREEIHRLQQQLKHGDVMRDLAGLTKKSATLNYVPVYPVQGVHNSIESKINKSKSVDGVLLSERPKSSANLKKSLSADQTRSSFLYGFEKMKSVSLPYSSNILSSESNLVEKKDDKQQKVTERNGLMTSIWNSFRPRSAVLSQQYHGDPTTARVGKRDV
ncbi:uncharacterized protein LOC106642148 isoform X2 [Copidosoma floridanum]|uniref:uncharacterized protein LOC106642148 isoform X2 n=1 Tax=Copidosoma floridanum TaxID=29053 RepID=UPI0006C979F6|nr:uncharacterized protein LOC106642148 isoform X2 [Copidosoma floridanum]